MMPGNVLSDTAVRDPFLLPMRRRSNMLVDYERGGPGIGNSTGDMFATVWTTKYSGTGDVIVYPDSGVETVLFNKPGITELALAFDQNMQAFIAYVDAAGAHYWWWDSTAGGHVHTDLPAGSFNPRACLDDHRPLQTSASDIILAYGRGTNLYMRQQRDRFQTEYLLKTGFGRELVSVGMNVGWRLQFKCLPIV